MGAVDADGHVIEAVATWEFMGEGDEAYTPQMLHHGSGTELLSNEGIPVRDFWVIEGRAHGKDRNVGTNTPQESRDMLSIEARLNHMDELGIDVQVLYPTLFLRPVVLDRERERALCNSYNRWLGDIWSRSEGRLRWVVMPPLLSLEAHPQTVRDQIAWAKDNGAVGIFMRGLECERALCDPYFFPLYEMAGEFDLAVCVHSANGSFITHDFFRKYSGFATFKMAVVTAFHMLLDRDVPAKFPDVRWGFLETGAQWLPYVLNDIGTRRRRNGQPFAERPLAANRMWVACENTDDLDMVLNYVDEDHLVIGTDYGHHDQSTEINAIHLMRNDARISPATIERILDRNPRALYGLD